MTREQYIERHSALFWYTPQDRKKNISDKLLVETILNEGSMDDVRQLFALMGMENVAKVFFAVKGQETNNYYPEIRNFFTLVFNHYVPQVCPER